MRLVDLLAPMASDEAAPEAFKARATREIGAELTLAGFGGRVFLRVSAHAYNTPGAYDALAARLPGLLP